MKKHAIHTKKVGDYLITGTEDKVIYRLRVGVKRENELGDSQRRGVKEIPGRLLDMDLDGINAEIVFPSLGLWLYCLDNADAEKASCEVYNNWNNLPGASRQIRALRRASGAGFLQHQG